MSDNFSDLWKLRKRGQRDSERHKELIKETIKKKGKDIIGEYNIVKSDGTKKIKVPIKYMEKYQFKYGKLKNDGGVGQGLGGKKGDRYKISNGDPQKAPGNGEPGKDKGEDLFELEMSIDELVDILLEDMDLPWLKQTESEEIETEDEQYTSLDRVGIMPNLDIRKSLIENLKRNAAKGEPYVGDFKKEDLRYRDWEVQIERHSNASIYLLLDRSGSMNSNRTMHSKIFFFWMVQFIKRRYKKADIVFIAHDTEARLLDEDSFFKILPSGGTTCSSALELAYQHMSLNHPPDKFSNYVYHISDGDNLTEDYPNCKKYVQLLSKMSCAIGYSEVILQGESFWMGEKTLRNQYIGDLNVDNFVTSKISNKDDIFVALKKFFAADKSGKK